MSFQGDVAGIGLGELLQSLARGGQDGVLRLFGEHLSCSLGIRGGLLFLLPGSDEDGEELRLRCQRAWEDDPDPQFEDKRREDIANASRLETLYDLILSSNVHFRFEPGPVPIPEVADDYAGSTSPQWSRGLSVEYVLLEHARLTDESMDGGNRLGPWDVPRILDFNKASVESHAFVEHCTGRNTLRELSDRMGWTLLQTCVVVHDHVQQGTLRMSEPRELLVASQHELTQRRYVRARDRLTAWVLKSAPGPPYAGDADLILAEWEEGGIKEVLGEMKEPVARALLRKLDLADPDHGNSVARWEVLRQAHRRDNITALHLAAFKLSDVQQQGAAINDFTRLIRSLEEEGKSTRARTLMRMATAEVPVNEKVRVDLATQMLELGMTDEGVEWLLAVARELLAKKRGERAAAPLREVLREFPEHEEAKQLLFESKQQGVRRRKRKVHMMVGMATAGVLSVAALVGLRAQRETERKLEEVTDLMSDPARALATLSLNFPADKTPRINELRESLEIRLKDKEDQQRSDWIARYDSILTECRDGDPLLGLESVLDLENPPQLIGNYPPFPAKSEILNVLGNRLAQLAEEVHPPLDATEEELLAETRLVGLLETVHGRTAEKNDGTKDMKDFGYRVSEIYEDLKERRATAKVDRREAARRSIEEQQDLLLASARAHAANGDMERAVRAFDELAELEGSEELIPLLAEEINKVKTQREALRAAEELAELGDHEAAFRALEGAFEHPDDFALPWTVESNPPGATVEFVDGSLLTAPFSTESRRGEAVELTFSLIGHEDQSITVLEPYDLDVHMHLLPERAWGAGHKVSSAPVPVGEDHIVADRFGRLGRLRADGEMLWQHELPTLSGIARTPVFLPESPGQLLVISEDGEAWLVDAANGLVQGPWPSHSPPLEGPIQTRHGVSVRFADGRVALWRTQLEPIIYEAISTYLESTGSREWNSKADTIPSSLSVHRRGPDTGPRAVSPFADWSVEVRDFEYRVRYDGTESGFTVSRRGDWSYMAWEAPNVFIPDGRLWISDESGLRSFLPTVGILAAVEEPRDDEDD